MLKKWNVINARIDLSVANNRPLRYTPIFDSLITNLFSINRFSRTINCTVIFHTHIQAHFNIPLSHTMLTLNNFTSSPEMKHCPLNIPCNLSRICLTFWKLSPLSIILAEEVAND